MTAAANARGDDDHTHLRLETYLAAGSGDRKDAREAVRKWVLWKLSRIGVTAAPGYSHVEFSAVSFETAGDIVPTSEEPSWRV